MHPTIEERNTFWERQRLMPKMKEEPQLGGARSHESAGLGVRVAVLDSGYNPAFPLIAESVGRGRSKAYVCEEGGSGFLVHEVEATQNSDSSGHGSCVHSCIVSVAPGAEVGHFRILDEFNNCSSRLLCLALDYVLDQGYQIINLSLGTRNEALVPWLVSIMKRAYESNVSIVAASSNIGNALFPGRFTYCISVLGASGLPPDGVVYNPRNVIEFAGFGVNVPVSVGPAQLIRVTGSSYASGHITGLCARLLSERGGVDQLDPLQLKLLLRDRARLA
jgi:subtilisin